MNKPIYITLITLILASLVLGACYVPASAPPPATSAPAPAAPSPAPAAKAAATPATAATAVPANRPAVPAPVDDGRALGKLTPAERNERFGAAAPVSTKPGVLYVATIITDKGSIVAELYPDAPQGVNNFVTLAKNGYYDGLTFHRVEPGFVIQGGDPNGDGTGGPGYTVPAEITHTHSRGALAWARTGDQVNPERRSSGSQFYITLQDTPFLDGQYSVFGQVIEGLDIIDKIAVGDKIQRIDIVEAQGSRLPTPTPTPLPKMPKMEDGRPLAKLPPEAREALYNTPPQAPSTQAAAYEATVKTSQGDVVIALDPKSAPNAVSNFVLLANLGFFDGIPVAFVDPELYLVTGSPASRPDSDVGYALEPELGSQGLQVITGTVAMYPSFDQFTGDVRASGSQFFISLVEVPENETPLSILGKVVTGLDIVSKLTMSDTLTSITIAEK